MPSSQQYLSLYRDGEDVCVCSESDGGCVVEVMCVVMVEL